MNYIWQIYRTVRGKSKYVGVERTHTHTQPRTSSTSEHLIPALNFHAFRSVPLINPSGSHPAPQFPSLCRLMDQMSL